jgi:protease I
MKFKTYLLASIILSYVFINTIFAQTFDQMEKGRHALRSSIKGDLKANQPKVLIIIGDGAEVLDTMGPYYRLGEDYNVHLAAPEVDSYNLVTHELIPGWDITQEKAGYRMESDIAFKDVNPAEFIALVLPGGRAPEYLRYDKDLIKITQHFFEEKKPVASICHGIEILATAGVLADKKVTTIPKCRFDVTVAGGIYVTDPVIRDGNLLCCRGKKDISPWMKRFTFMIQEYLTK